MKRIPAFLSVLCLTVGAVQGQNLLSNGDFNLDVDANTTPDNWSKWTYGTSGFADLKSPDAFAKDGTPYINAGNYGDWWSSGGGWNQVVGGTAGMSYTLTSFCATEGWDNAAGEMRLIFLDGASGVIRQDVLHTAEFLASMAWTSFSMTSIAPAGTAEVKVEFATWGARGAVLWDDAVLTSVPEPGALAFGMLGLGAWVLRRKKGV